ncbi:MAG TPA: ATP-binding protein [Anaeromyxobacter sp.]|nr:ATP-binding protein [Anaeromyxobacter sp.]
MAPGRPAVGEGNVGSSGALQPSPAGPAPAGPPRPSTGGAAPVPARQGRGVAPDPSGLAWTRLGIGMVSAGYAAVALHGLVRSVDRTPEIATAAITAIAFVVARPRPRLASALAVATVWAEISFGLLATDNPRTSGVLVYPVLAAAAAFLVGGRAATVLAACSVAVLAGDATLDRAWGARPGGDGTHWTFVASLLTLGSALLARAVRRSYGAVLVRSEDARRRYAELFASAPDGLVALEPDGRVAEVNAAAAALLGASPAALEGAAIEDVLRRAGAAGEVDLGDASTPGSPLAVALERSGGAPRAVEISARREPGAGGHPILVLRDVTQRRLVEERLGHAQRLESVGRLAGAVAHDFNNVLQAIAGSAAAAAEHPEPRVRELAREIVEAERRGAALTRQLLAFARRDVHRPERLDLAEVVSGMERLLRRVLGPRHALALDLAPGVPVLTDRAQLEQATLNLVANARDAMPGGGTVDVAIRPLDGASAGALGSTLATPRQALLEVRDAGVGMTPEVKARIFEPFFSTKPRGQGTGLGLATVHGFAAQSGGHVEVESAPGRGSTFRVFLPAAEAA